LIVAWFCSFFDPKAEEDTETRAKLKLIVAWRPVNTGPSTVFAVFGGKIPRTPIRWGGDEFVVFARLTTDLSEASSIAEKLLNILQQPIECQSDMSVTISASIGIALYPFNADNIETLLKYADLAMYEVKSHNKNSYNFFKQPTFKTSETQSVITGF
jgi:predicted signal transduction protein with EAL and GGDEF domain